MGFEVIKCNNGVGFSFCVDTYANDLDWLLQKAYYVKQGCYIDTQKTAQMGNNCICEHHDKLKHEHDEFEVKIGKILDETL